MMEQNDVNRYNRGLAVQQATQEGVGTGRQGGAAGGVVGCLEKNDVHRGPRLGGRRCCRQHFAPPLAVRVVGLGTPPSPTARRWLSAVV